MKHKRYIISGGGTGGHIFPALAIAKEIERRDSESEFLFVGASDRMEMQKIPAAGYSIEGLWISGFQRSNPLKNIWIPLKLICSILKSFRIILRFKPKVVIGTGGYASGPLLWVASLLNIPTVIQEQNSFPGITNKILGSKVNHICVAYSGLEKFFPKEKLCFTGNPIRAEIESGGYDKEKVVTSMGFDVKKPLVLVVGGSLGSKRINETILKHISWFQENDVQLIWQTGSLYYNWCKPAQELLGDTGIIKDFLSDMGAVLTAADVVISRAGAIALSELCAIGKASILVPSPNVAEDHQKKNALALSEKQAAILVEEKQMDVKLFQVLNELVFDVDKQRELATNCAEMHRPNATEKIVDLIQELPHD
jgi:UDP-N-acetylglucosamine--N-acetylmuramyl-(pentapeptide) pyrophosphoryl-undecaprenol N-acetylglucosamine transferase